MANNSVNTLAGKLAVTSETIFAILKSNNIEVKDGDEILNDEVEKTVRTTVATQREVEAKKSSEKKSGKLPPKPGTAKGQLPPKPGTKKGQLPPKPGTKKGQLPPKPVAAEEISDENKSRIEGKKDFQKDGQKKTYGQNKDGFKKNGKFDGSKSQDKRQKFDSGDEEQPIRRPAKSQQKPRNQEEPMLKKPGSDRAKHMEREKEREKERDKNIGQGKDGRKNFNKNNNQGRNGLRDLSAPQHKKPVKKPKPEKVAEEELIEVEPGTIVINVPITVNGFAQEIDKPTSVIIMKLMQMGIMATINQNLDEDTVLLLAEDLGVDIVVGSVESEVVEEGIDTREDREDELQSRPPIITVMGHVDHGKTSLLDAIRSTSITATEAGGITQHIGASEVFSGGQKIVCLDTPGHEAFTAMRARGAQVTDIAILVVAADDSVKPQTVEAISHAKAAGVPIIVAINKIDKPAANPEKVKQDLMQHNILVEEFGGETICVPVSAKTGEGIDNLLEMVLLQAEMLDLRANPNRACKGTVVEARLDKAKGPVMTVLIMKGTLQIGQPIVAGVCSGRVRAMTNWKGEPLKKAGPATAVEIIGLSDVPEAGDEVDAVRDERSAKTIASNRQQKLREETIKEKTRVSLEDLFSQIQKGDTKELNIIVKADVMGSVGAVTESLQKLSTDEVTVKVVYSGVGTVTESDILLATASNAIIIGFNIRPSANVMSVADREGVEIHTYRIIYEAIEDIKAAMIGMLDPEFKEVVLGSVEIRTTFKVPGVGTIGGAYVTDGKIERNASIRLVRDGIVIHEGVISSLKRFKDDAKEVLQGFECGIGIENYNDIKEGDVIEAFAMEEIERKQL